MLCRYCDIFVILLIILCFKKGQGAPDGENSEKQADESDSKSGNSANTPSTNTTAKSLAATLGSIEKSELEVSSPPVQHVNDTPKIIPSHDTSPDEPGSDRIPRYAKLYYVSNLLFRYIHTVSMK